MSIAPPLDASPPLPEAAPRLLPDSHRYRWEQQWLQENRNVSRVIASADSAAQRAAAATQPTPKTSVRAATPPPLQPAATALAKTAQPAPATANTRTAAIASYAAAAGDNTTPAPKPDTATQARVPAVTRAAAAAPRRTPPRRAALRRFGLWLEGDEVTLSLRLAPDQSAAGALATLHRWLGGLGLRLRAAIVNGELRWRRDDGPAGY